MLVKDEQSKGKENDDESFVHLVVCCVLMLVGRVHEVLRKRGKTWG
jgi:hypothetical protein